MSVTRIMVQNAVNKENFTPPTSVRHPMVQQQEAHITINGNGGSVKALVVDHCDSTMGCDGEHGYQPLCSNNIVDASKSVWKALGVNEKNKEWGWMDITWSYA
ncbi:hypothetical protein POTOM_013940 [Populus tomentosa]|uniref:Uncharacterized protein n=1 Tax=Populus tomentosa TaxID=118781 RepID=A0A8X8D7D9_POPTO|nr:hypothetical protein POTOM_013940 [Populus tomentosa]